MRVGVVGINHKQADLGLRELVAHSCQHRFGSCCSSDQHRFLLLSTCNRTEIYFSSEDPAETHRLILSMLREDLSETTMQHFYSFFSGDCFEHLARVSSGLDSAVIGETEIQGQVKQAYETAREHLRSSELHFLFQRSLQIAKRVRSSLQLRSDLPDTESAILQAGRRIFPSLETCRVLFVGASEINSQVLHRFKEDGLKEITVCNRTAERALLLARTDGVEMIPWNQLGRWLQYDLIVFGTKCPGYLINLEQLPADLQGQKLIVDLSVPRNVEPGVGRHPQIALYNIEKLHREVEKSRKLNAEVLRRVNRMLYLNVHRQMRLRRERLSAYVPGYTYSQSA